MESHTQSPPGWLAVLRAYLLISAAGHLAWETLQLPLYTIWSTASPSALVVAVLHCTAGDVLIALAVLAGSLLLVGDSHWPHRGYLRIGLLSVVFGLAYTVFSEWLNTGVRANWTYSGLMPTLPVLGTGLAPLLQWVVVPPLAFLAAGRCAHEPI